ncbi:MAG: ABC transporter substrate-binding protein [Bradyrhizobiaceae bacterium]|nr:ABC transporter substrate-binding protein [Bradyrhizobiaceae bacterium]
MAAKFAALATAVFAAVALSNAQAGEPKHGGILKIYHRETPPSLSIHEEATFSVNVPAMGIFNNLVLYDQHKPQNSIDTIVPELATSWAWSKDQRELTFKLRSGVKWHDNMPFTAKDVKCTFDLLQGKGQDKFRKNPRKDWYANVSEVTVDGDNEVTFHLTRPQPSLLAMLASGYTPIYPCHVPAAQMRTNPIGTGPFKFVEMKQNESIKLVKNSDYWKKGVPYLDGIEYTIIQNRATAVLAFVAGKVDVTFPTEMTAALTKDIKQQDPNAICEIKPINVSTNLIVNRDSPPFNDPELRTAMSMALDRKAFIDIILQGEGDIGGSLLPQPEGVWGMPPDLLKTISGYGDVAKDREKARAIMTKLGYSATNPLKIKVATRNLATYRDPAAVLIDQLKTIYIDAELEPVESSSWFAKVARKDYQVGLNLTGNGIDDPDQTFYENYSCNSERNYTHYCNKDLEKLFDQQSEETDLAKRKKLVWEIDKKIQEDVARPMLFHARTGTCWKPYVKNLTIMSNSAYNGYRFEDLWLDK